MSKVNLNDFQELEDYGVRVKIRDKKNRLIRVKNNKPRNKKKKHRGGFNKYEENMWQHWADDS